MHTSKGVQSICSVCVAGTVDHLSLWECQRIWLMLSRSPRLWLIIITGHWNNDFPWAHSGWRRTQGIRWVFLWWLNTWVWIWRIKADLDTTKCALWSSIQVINSGLACTVNSWIKHKSTTDIVFFRKVWRSCSCWNILFMVCRMKTNDDCCTF